VLAEGGKKKEIGDEKLEIRNDENTENKAVTESEIYDVAKDIFG
jgi:hypothetical protein